MDYAQVFVDSFGLLFTQLLGLIPRLFVALVIWIVGKYFLNTGVFLLKKVDVKEVKEVGKFVGSLVFVLLPLGKVLLVLIILDYLGIGRSVIAPVVSGFTYAIAIAAGIAFGRALEPDARRLVDGIKKQLEK